MAPVHIVARASIQWEQVKCKVSTRDNLKLMCCTSSAGTVNGNGVLQMEVSRTGQDTTLSASPCFALPP